MFEIGTGGHAGLLVPAATFRLRQRVGLGVVVEVIRPSIQQQVRTVEAAVLPGCTVLGMQDGFRQGPVAEIVGARETDDRGALLISGGGVRIPRREILAVDLESLARPVQVLVTQDRTDGEVVLRVGGSRVTRADESLTLPMEEIVGTGEPGLVADSVVADVQHVEAPVGAKDDGIVDAALVEVAFLASGAENQFRVFVRRSVRCDRIYSCVCEGSGSRYSSGLETPLKKPPPRNHCVFSGTRTATPCGGRVISETGVAFEERRLRIGRWSGIETASEP